MDKQIISKLSVVKSDITRLQVDIIVNAANQSLLGGGGVDGAIHRAAGPMLLEECRNLGGCPTGEAKITKGYNLPAQWVIHTVGPIYSAKLSDKKLLEACYHNSLKLALSKKADSIAFPAISCGVYGYPVDKACKIAVDTCISFLKENTTSLGKIIFSLFSTKYEKVYQEYISCLNEKDSLRSGTISTLQ